MPGINRMLNPECSCVVNLGSTEKLLLKQCLCSYG